MTQIYLIRHGEAEGNVFRRLHGVYNSLLLPRGYQQRALIEKRFETIPVDACFSSDLTRACLTAQSIYLPKGLQLQIDPGFREQDMGVWEDIPYGYLEMHYPRDMELFSHDPVRWKVHGSESYRDFTDRFIAALEKVAKDYDGATVAIFCHGAVLRGALMRLFFGDDPHQLPVSDNTGVSHLYYEKGRFTYEYLNDTSHLPEELSTFAQQAWWRKTDNRKEANLYFTPCQGEACGFPGWEPGDLVMTARFYSGPVGAVCLGKQEGTTGHIRGITLEDGYYGRGYGAQLLGCAVSHFRRLGCDRITLSPQGDPEALAQSYGFDLHSFSRSIDPEAFVF